MPFCSNRIYTNITIEMSVKVNITPPAATQSVMVLTLPPPPPGLQNNKELPHTEDTKLKSTERVKRSALYVSQVVTNLQSMYKDKKKQTCTKQFAPFST